MHDNNILINIFFDCLYTNLICVFSSEIYIWFAIRLTEINTSKLLASAFCGVLCASLLNYIQGYILYKMFEIVRKKIAVDSNYIVMQQLYKTSWIFLVCFSWMFLYFKCLTFFAGFTRFSILKIIIGSSIIRTIHYVI